MYFQALNDLLFQMRYNPFAMFSRMTGELYTGLGVYGSGPIRIRWRPPSWYDKKGGFAYKAMQLKDVFILVDADGNVEWYFVRMWMNARQFASRFPGVTPPRSIAAELMKPQPSETQYFEIVHCVYPRKDYDENAITVKRHPIASSYIAVLDGAYVGPEGGFRSFPYLMPRTMTEPGEIYGYSPAMQAMPALGSLNAMKRTVLRQGQKAVDPVILAHDDGSLSGRVGQTPGYVNMGGINAEGKPLIQPMPTGDFNVAETLIADERNDVNDAFLVTLFQILMETPEMTATEVVERIGEKAALAAPTMGVLQAGMLGPMVGRELDLTLENNPGILPVPPPELVEAGGEYQVIYTSPLAKALTAEEDSGFMRINESAINIATATGNPEPLDHFKYDVAIPEISDHMAVPARWMNSMEEIQAIRTQRAADAKTAQLATVAPQIASVAKTTQQAQQAT